MDVLVAGAGAAGVAAARVAAEAGPSVLVVEKYGFSGGAAVAAPSAACTWPRTKSAYPSKSSSVSLSDSRTSCLETLVRWRHPTLGLLKPKDFIPIAEETGDIDSVGAWVLKTAARQVSTWRAAISGCSSLWVSINISARQLSSPRSLVLLKEILTDPASEAENVILEITETTLATDTDGGIAALCTLKESGARVAIDYFGTGFSSLSTLATLPADILKIDRSLLAHADQTSKAILEGIVGLAHKLKLDVIAEGIEETRQLQTMRALGCRMGQGYFLAMPAPPHAIEGQLRSNIYTPFPLSSA